MSCPLIVLVTIHDTRRGHVLIILWATLNVMSLHAFEALQISILRLCLAPLFRGFGYVQPHGALW
jgi:hypothetical protein